MAEESTSRNVSRGSCGICGGTFAKASMTRHLTTCMTRQATAAAAGKPAPSLVPHYHVVVQGRHAPGYWLHLAVRSTATLSTLDRFLRDVWLECCGHLSDFTIGQKHYASDPAPPFAGLAGFGFAAFAPAQEERSMRVALNRVLQPGGKAAYEYDFGTTTELTLAVAGEHDLPRSREAVRVLARNDAPAIACSNCGAAAMHVCTECVWEGEGWLCAKCAADHECGEEMLLPVVNSPRVGMCAYTG